MKTHGNTRSYGNTKIACGIPRLWNLNLKEEYIKNVVVGQMIAEEDKPVDISAKLNLNIKVKIKPE